MDGKKRPTTPPVVRDRPAAGAPPPMDLATPPGFPTPMAYPPGFPTPVNSQAPAVSAPAVAPPPGFPTPLASHPPTVSAPPGFPTPVASLPAFYTPGERRGRGRPRGSVNRARHPASAPANVPPTAASGGAPPAAAAVPVPVPASEASPGNDFVPHTMIVPPGEDVSMRISYFAQEMNPRAVCVISATGMVSSSVVSNSGSPNGVYRNNGDLYDLTTLGGSYTYSSNRRSGSLKVVLTRHDGEVVAGTVSGPLVAATPIIVVLGSFRQESVEQEEIRHDTESSPMTDDY